LNAPAPVRHSGRGAGAGKNGVFGRALSLQGAFDGNTSGRRVTATLSWRRHAVRRSTRTIWMSILDAHLGRAGVLRSPIGSGSGLADGSAFRLDTGAPNVRRSVIFKQTSVAFRGKCGRDRSACMPETKHSAILGLFSFSWPCCACGDNQYQPFRGGPNRRAKLRPAAELVKSEDRHPVYTN
jgi:hypothetical protein